MSTEDEQAFPSTTWKWKQVKMRPSAGGHVRSTRTKGGFRRLSPWARHRELTVRILHKGGAESWYLIKARGTHEVFPGHLCLEDVMRRVYSEN